MRDKYKIEYVYMFIMYMCTYARIYIIDHCSETLDPPQHRTISSGILLNTT